MVVGWVIGGVEAVADFEQVGAGRGVLEREGHQCGVSNVVAWGRGRERG